MQNPFTIFSILLIAGLTAAVSLPDTNVNSATPKASIKWYSWEEAIELSKENPKKIFIDVYTDWCGWCKRMDKTTFSDPEVSNYINANFYPVKFDAEQKEEILYKGHTLKYVGQGRRGYHELAYSLLDGRMGYPAFVYLDESQNRITISPGYKDQKMMIKELKFIGGELYKEMTFEQYSKQ